MRRPCAGLSCCWLWGTPSAAVVLAFEAPRAAVSKHSQLYMPLHEHAAWPAAWQLCGMMASQACSHRSMAT